MRTFTESGSYGILPSVIVTEELLSHLFAHEETESQKHQNHIVDRSFADIELLVQMPLIQLISPVALGKFLNLSEFYSPHLYNNDDNISLIVL